MSKQLDSSVLEPLFCRCDLIRTQILLLVLLDKYRQEIFPLNPLNFLFYLISAIKASLLI